MHSLEILTNAPTSFAKAIEMRDEAVWRELSKISLIQASEYFLSTLNGHTQRAYRAAFDSIFHLFTTLKLFDPRCDVQAFALANLEFLLDEIRLKIHGSEATKQARSAAFIAFTRHLQRATGGVVRKVVPRKEKGNSTFRQIRETSLTKALTRSQWTCFLCALKRISFRDYLVAKMILQGAKRVGEVLTAQIHQIDWQKSQIYFKQSKSNELEKYTVISYPKSFMDELIEYIGDRKCGPIFHTRNGKFLTQPHLYRSFSKAGLLSGIPFTVHPHVLRASAITYLSSQGFRSDQIMRVSGHSNEKLVRYYDKTPIEQNITREVSLI